MKKGDKPKLDSAWWQKNKAKTLKDKALGTALKAYEKSGAKYDWPGALKALASAKKAAFAAASKCNQKLHRETLDVLVKYPALIDEQVAIVQRANDSEKSEKAEIEAKRLMDRTLGVTVVALTKTQGDNHAPILYMDWLIKQSAEIKKEFRGAPLRHVAHLRRTHLKLLDTALREHGRDLPKNTTTALKGKRKQFASALDNAEKLGKVALKTDDEAQLTKLFAGMLRCFKAALAVIRKAQMVMKKA